MVGVKFPVAVTVAVGGEFVAVVEFGVVVGVGGTVAVAVGIEIEV